MKKIREIWSNRWVRFGLVTFIYLLWFVVWTQNAWWLLGVPVIYDYFISRKIDVLFLNKYRAFKVRHKSFKWILEWIEALLFAVVVVTPLRLFFFGLYVIPSSSMEGTLLVGDYLYVNRLAYGPKMPITPISLPFVHNTLPFSSSNTPSYVDWIQYDYKRLAGFDTPQAGDVVVFNFPEGDTVALVDPISSYYELVRAYGREAVYSQSEVVFRPVDKRENYIKRCVAVAGDTLQVVEDLTYVNGVQSEVPSRLIVEPLGDIPVTDAVFPHTPELYPWTHRNFGPLWVPRAGVTVDLTLENLPLYQRIIKNYELNDLRVEGETIYINGQVATQYTFRMDYYFMMGDNRDNSLDSRYWGFVPEDHIEGEASFVWLSITPGESIFGGLRWGRMFKSIK
ncbi:MAG: signal peptidase I [Rikenellaceae bacterium]